MGLYTGWRTFDDAHSIETMPNSLVKLAAAVSVLPPKPFAHDKLLPSAQQQGVSLAEGCIRLAPEVLLLNPNPNPNPNPKLILLHVPVVFVPITLV